MTRGLCKGEVGVMSSVEDSSFCIATQRCANYQDGGYSPRNQYLQK